VYKIVINNNGTETLIHYPTADKNAPHILQPKLKESETEPDSLSFLILPNNPGYDLLTELVTRIYVYNTQDNSVKFAGRILNIKDSQDNSLARDITCESIGAYLYDTIQPLRVYSSAEPSTILGDILATHNSKVDESKRIQLGNISITGPISKEIQPQRTLAAVVDLRNELGGQLRTRIVNGVKYLDYEQEQTQAANTVKLGINMRSMMREYDVTQVATRIKGIGQDELTFGSVNNGIDYVEVADSPYGIIEDEVRFNDEADPAALKNKTVAVLNERKVPIITLEANALDLSTINADIERYKRGNKIRVNNPLMNIDTTLKIVELETDLLEPWNPRLTLSNKPTTLTSKLIEFQTTTNIVNKVTTQSEQINTYYLEGIINALKNQLVASGSYQNAQVIEGKGLLFENTNESSPDYGALYIGPGLMAIANTKNTDGSWNWRTFGTGKGFTADEINGGTITGITIRTAPSGSRIQLDENFLTSYEGDGIVASVSPNGFSVCDGSANGIDIGGFLRDDDGSSAKIYTKTTLNIYGNLIKAMSIDRFNINCLRPLKVSMLNGYDNQNIIPLPFGCYLESLPDGLRLHADDSNYICIGHGYIDGYAGGSYARLVPAPIITPPEPTP
jgi:phage minor structural protein